MALTKEQSIDQITVTEEGTILYREVTRILEDDQELTKSYHRSSIYPGQDLANVPVNVASIANVVWTKEIISAYAAKTEGAI